MQTVFENIIEKLEDAKSNVPVNRLLDDIIKDKPKELGQLMAYNKAIEIVKQEAVEYNNGWIPCSDKLPPQPEVNPIFENKPLELYLVSVKGADYPIRAFWNGKFFTDGWSKLDAVAWQPLPEPYNPTGMNRAKTKDGKYEPYLGGWK